MGSKGSQQTQQAQQYTPDPAIRAGGYQALQSAMGLQQNPFNTPIAPVAGFQGDQQRGFQQLRDMQGMTDPYFHQAAQYANQSAGPVTGAEVNQYYNPFAQNVFANMAETFGQQNRNVTGQLTQAAGGIGADRIAVGQSELARQQGLAQGQTAAGIYSQALQAAQQDKARQAQAGFELGALGQGAQGAALQGTQALMGAGNLQQQLQQAQMNAPYQNQLQQIAWPYQNTQYLAGITGGLAPALGGNTDQQNTYPGASPWGAIAGAGMAGVGLMGATGGFGQNGWMNNGMKGTSLGAMPQPGAPQAVGYGSNRGGRINPFATGGGVEDQSQWERYSNFRLGLNEPERVLYGREMAKEVDDFNPDARGAGRPQDYPRPNPRMRFERAEGYAQGGSPIGDDPFKDLGGQSPIPDLAMQPGTGQRPILQDPNKQGSGQQGPDIAAMALKILPMLLKRGGGVPQFADGGLYDGSDDNPFGAGGDPFATPVQTESIAPSVPLTAEALRAHGARRASEMGIPQAPPQAPPPPATLEAPQEVPRAAMQAWRNSFREPNETPQVAALPFANPDDDKPPVPAAPPGPRDPTPDAEDPGAGLTRERRALPPINAEDYAELRSQKTLADNPWMALAHAGFGTLAASGQRDARGLPMSPWSVIGAGAMKGVEQLGIQKKELQADKAIDLNVRKLMQQADEHRKTLEYQYEALDKPYGEQTANQRAELARHRFEFDQRQKMSREQFNKPYEELTKQQQATVDHQREQLAETKRYHEILGNQSRYTPAGSITTENGEVHPLVIDTRRGGRAIDAVTGEPPKPTDKQTIKGVPQANAVMTEGAVDNTARQYLAGDHRALQNIGRGTQGAEDMRRIRNRIAEIMKERNVTPEEQAAVMANYTAQVAAARTAAVREANVGAAVEEARNTFPLALQRSQELPRGSFVPWNQAVQMVQSKTSSPELARFVTANQAVISAYAQAMSRIGVTTVHSQQSAERLLNTATSPEAYKAVIGQMEQEMQAALKAPEVVRQHILKRISDVPGVAKAAKEPPPPELTTPKRVEQNGHTYERQPDGTYKAVQ